MALNQNQRVTQVEVSLHPGQAAIFNSDARFKVCAAGRRFGKSHLAAYMLGIEAMRTENAQGYELSAQHGVYYIAPTFDQAKRIMWPKLRELLRYQKVGGLIANENTNDGWIELVNKRRIYIRGADNPDSLRGIALSYVVMDEYADMKPNVWTEIVGPALMDVQGEALFIGTPKGKNHFYKLFMAALEYKFDPLQEPRPLYEAFHFKSSDNVFLNQKEVERMMKDSNVSMDVLKQELEASFVSGGGKVLKPDNFPVIIRPADEAGGSIVISCDLAGFSKESGNKLSRLDESVIGVTLVTPEAWDVLDMAHGHWDVRETALRLVKTVSKYPGSRLGVEKGALLNAVGPYLEDYMREFNRYVTVEPLSHGNQKKTDRIMWALQGRSERGKVRLVKGDWNQWFLDQIADFPDPLAHDDGIDTIAYVDQMASVSYVEDTDVSTWEALDMDSGY